MGDKCKVSIALLTYNHEEYISQSIESALMQKCDFDYEIVIGEDCSTDTQLFSDEERMYKTYKVHKEDICTFEEFYETTPLIPTGTFLFRRSSLGSNFRVYYVMMMHLSL